jgi:hypothetical protein
LIPFIHKTQIEFSLGEVVIPISEQDPQFSIPVTDPSSKVPDVGLMKDISLAMAYGIS